LDLKFRRLATLGKIFPKQKKDIKNNFVLNFCYSCNFHAFESSGADHFFSKPWSICKTKKKGFQKKNKKSKVNLLQICAFLAACTFLANLGLIVFF